MASNKKPRKKYRQRPVLNPLNMRDEWDIEGQAHAVLLAIESGSVSEDHLAMLAAHSDMVRRIYTSGPENIQANAVIRVIRDIKDRDVIVVRKLEEATIRAALVVTIKAIRDASNYDIYRAAVAAVKDMERNGGAIALDLQTCDGR